MSEGQRFISVQPNMTFYLPGCAPLRFKNFFFPQRKTDLCYDDQVIEQAKRHPDYGKLFITEEDKIKRDTPEPMTEKQEEDMTAAAVRALQSIPGVQANDAAPPAKKKAGAVVGSFSTSSSRPVVDNEAEEPEPPGPAIPTLTSVQRMKKDDLFEVADNFDISLEENDTAAIIRRKVKSWIKRNT